MRLDFAGATQTVLYVMAAAAVVAILGLRRGVQQGRPGAEEPGRSWR